MNLLELKRKLTLAARAQTPAEGVPFAFEKRIIALLKNRPELDFWEVWSGALWRAAAPCVAIALLLGIWSFVTPESPDFQGDLGQDIEQAVLAAVEPDSFEATW